MTFSTEIIITIICSVFASSGFWAWLMARQKRNTAEKRMILGLGYRSICELCTIYIKQGYISHDDYSDLKKYMYEPYRDMGGDGTVERLMKEVDKLPIKEG